MNVYFININKIQIRILIFLLLEILFHLVYLEYLMLLFIIVILSSPNPCKSIPGLFKLIKDIHYQKNP